MIDILISTYNGEQFLREQLDSLLAQTHTDWTAFVRDDGSTDNTREIIKYYTQSYPEKFIVYTDKLGNVGPKRSFEELLTHCAKNEYIMFCDQDDVWLPEKIARTLAAIKTIEQKRPQKPALAYTDMLLVDENTQSLNITFWKFNRLKMPKANQWPWLCVANPMAGCSCMINSAARDAVLPFPKDIPMHDWWILAQTTRLGITTYIDAPTSLYRQHQANYCGVRRPGWRYYIHIIGSPIQKWNEFAKLRPFLNAIGFGSVAKFTWYKVIYAVLRRL